LKITIIPVLAAAATLAGCSIVQKVDPVPVGSVEQVCVERNTAVHMDGFHPDLSRLIEAQGYKVSTIEGAAPAACSHIVSYTANWGWDLAMYLTYARVEVMQDGRRVGQIEYDARSGSGNMGKFGATSAKLQPLVAQLFPKR